MTKILLIFCAYCITMLAHAQDFNDYKPLKNTGKLPDDFTLPSSVQYNNAVKGLSKKRTENKAEKKDFYLKTSFTIGELMRSGIVLVDTEYTAYMQSIVNLLLKNKPDVAKKIRVYILRSSAVNAVATANGCILVSLGLLAQLDTEAQLAFVLAHEISHIEKQHSLDLFMKSVTMDKKKRESSIEDFKEDKLDVKQFRKHAHSRGNELEADTEGFKLFAKTTYIPESAIQVFEILRYANLPFGKTKFEKTFLETKGITIPDSLFPAIVNPIKGQDDDTEDDKYTHPNLGKRKKAIYELMANNDNTNKQDFLISKNTFEKLKKVARFELPAIGLHNQDFMEVLYNVFLLSKDNNESIYLDKSKIKALYGLTKYTQLQDNNLVSKADAELIEGELHQIYHFFSVINQKDLPILAILHIQEMRKKYPKDTEIDKLYTDLVWELTEDVEDIAELEKNIKASWYPDAITALKADNDFEKMFTKMSNERKKDTNINYKEKKKINKMKKQRLKKGANLGIDKIVCVSSVFLVIDARNDKSPIDFLASEKMQDRLNKQIKKYTKKMKLNAAIITKNEIKETDSEKMNDATILNEWFKEQSIAKQMPIWGYRQQDVENIAQKYGTDYCLWIAMVSAKHIKGTLMLAVLYNVKTGRNEIIKENWFNVSAQKWLIDMHLYDTLKQIKGKK
ncbi:MAG: hypothetical protein EAZ95_10010 [Bacteroidetes bacterium]|nr:MAG: hypothetical protein EAZ95_10010 [Bacteroidota bacterium]